MTTDFRHGKDAILKLADVADSLTDISVYAASFTPKRTNKTVDITTLSKQADVFLGGLAGGTMGIAGKVDATILPILVASLGKKRAFEFGVLGSGTGMPKTTGSCLGSDLAIDVSHDKEVTFTMNLQFSDALTDAAYS